MSVSDIKLADQVRRIIGRHYIKPRGLRILVGRGSVRILGELERTGAKAYQAIDEDTIHRLKSEIKHLKGVKTVAIEYSGETNTDSHKAEEAATEHKAAEKAPEAEKKPRATKEDRKKAFAEALRKAMEAKKNKILGANAEKEDSGKEEQKPPAEEEKAEPEPGEPENVEDTGEKPEYTIPLEEEEMPEVAAAAEPETDESATEEAAPASVAEVKVIRYRKYQGTTESSWAWTAETAYNVLGEYDWERFKEAHCFFRLDLPGHEDEIPPATVEAYALPHHVLKGGSLKTHWPGIVFAMAALLGEESGINIPRIQKRDVYDHLSRHYKDEFNKFPPELIEMAPEGKNFSECEPDELVEEPWGYADFKDYHEKQGINMWWLTLEAWKSALSADIYFGFDEPHAEEPQQRRSSRILRRISKAFRGGRGRGEIRLSPPIEKLLETVDETEIRLGQTAADQRAAEKLTALAGALRTFTERYAHASKHNIGDSHIDLLGGLDRALGKVFEHIASLRYSREDLEALIGVVDRLTLLSKSKGRGG